MLTPASKANNAYPVDSVIIEAKYPDDERENIELFTVMRKGNRDTTPITEIGS